MGVNMGMCVCGREKARERESARERERERERERDGANICVVLRNEYYREYCACAT